MTFWDSLAQIIGSMETRKIFYSDPKYSSCDPKAIKRRGGISNYTVVHNACADKWTDTEYIDKDVKVRGIAFDGLKKLVSPPGTLYEIKMGMFYSTIRFQALMNPGKTKFLEYLKSKAIYGYDLERITAQFCSYEFGYGLKDQILMDDMKQFFRDKGYPDEAARIFYNGC